MLGLYIARHLLLCSALLLTSAVFIEGIQDNRPIPIYAFVLWSLVVTAFVASMNWLF